MMNTSTSTSRCPRGRLAAKRIIVTGTGGGQGAAAIELFCAEGASVVGCDVRPGAAEATAERLSVAGYCAFGSTVDLSDPVEAAKWVDSASETLGGLDVVYNNASSPRFQPFAEMTIDTWRFTITNELDIVFHVTQPAWRHLVAAGGGSIISTASAAATTAVGHMGQAAHSAAKGGVVALTRQLAAEGAPFGIRANSISPGFILTPGTSGMPEGARADMIQMHLLDRPGSAEEIARLALYLASDESAFVTGADVAIDGGWSIGFR